MAFKITHLKSLFSTELPPFVGVTQNNSVVVKVIKYSNYLNPILYNIYLQQMKKAARSAGGARLLFFVILLQKPCAYVAILYICGDFNSF